MAMRIFAALHRFAKTGDGDVKKLKGESGDLRLRTGDYRIRFTEGPDDSLHIHSVRHRSEAYR
jgi:mRNA-degrading endonuclease RelE of RelBE toxin-antitoxin system